MLWLFYLEKYSFILEGYFYIWFVFALIYSIWNFKINSKILLLYGFILYMASSLLTLVLLVAQAELTMRISFVLFLVGTVQAFFELRKTVK